MSTLTPNAQRLVRALVSMGPTYRADLARTLDVTRATVTNLIQRLQADGWVEDVDHEPGSLKTLIGTTPRLGVLASVLFLVDTCTVTVAGYDGRVLNESTVRGLPLDDALARLTTGADLIEQLLHESDVNAADLRAIHLAVDTQMDAVSGVIYAERASSRWFGVNPREYIESRFAARVYVENSARLQGLAEHLWGTGGDARDMFYVDVSQGITSAHLTDGGIQPGSRGGAGEIGHAVYDWNGPLCTCGNGGCLMQYASVPALLRDHETATGQRVQWDALAGLAAAGDEDAAATVHRAAVVLGRLLVSVCHVIDPETIVLGGDVAALPGFVDTVAETVHTAALPLVARHLRVLPATLEDVRSATARAGITSLRRLDAVATTAAAVP